MVGGDVHGVAPYFYQTGAHRPTPDLGQYTVPGVERLYLVGPFQHPGGGVYGAGRATAMRMFEQLGMNFARAFGTEEGAGGRRVSLGSEGSVGGGRGRGGGGDGAGDGHDEGEGGGGSGRGDVGDGAPRRDQAVLYGPANEELLVIRSVERDGNGVVVKGEAFGTLPLIATLRPAQARRLLKMVKFSWLPMLLRLLFGRSER
jgi:hypothetical protein